MGNLGSVLQHLKILYSIQANRVLFFDVQNEEYGQNEIVLHTPYSKARCPPPKKTKRKSTQLACIEYRIRTCCNTDPKRLPIMVRIHCKS